VENADTLAICNSLSHDRDTRNKLLDEALAASHKPATIGAPGTAKGPAEAPGQDGQAVPKKSPGATQQRQGEPGEDEDSPGKRLQKSLDELQKVGLPAGGGLPLGWNSQDARTVPRLAWPWVLKVLGWLLTAAAISLGAPFWFDVLGKFMVVRSTVKPHEKSPEEGSADRR
jgi:hypothetical protein